MSGDPIGAEALLQALLDGLPEMPEPSEGGTDLAALQAQNLKRLDAFETLVARQSETLFRAHLDGLRASQDGAETGAGLERLAGEMEALVTRTRRALLDQLTQALEDPDEP